MNDYFVLIRCKCSDYYKFIQKIASLNISIYDVKYEKKYLYFKVSNKNLEKLNKYLKSYKFEKVNNLGLTKILDYLVRYKELVICFIIGFMLLVIASNLIVDVRIIHENKEIRELLLDELGELGVKKLTFKKSYQRLQEIKKYLLDKYPDKLDWLEFEVDGMIYNVKVEERIITDTSKDNQKCHLVATKEGTISKMKVSSGEALVRPNDLVKPGDILISGIITYNNEEKARVCASGEVFAHTWYTVNVSIPFQHDEYIKTGKKKYNLVWQNKDNKTLIFKERFASYEKKQKTLLALFDYQILLETEWETQKITKIYSEDEALAEGLKKAEENLKKQLGPKDSIIDKKVLKKYVNDSKMDIEIFIIVDELISKKQNIIDENIEGNGSSDMEYNKSNHQ